MEKFLLIDEVSNKTLGRFPNEEGAMLSALFHMNNGRKILWEKGHSDIAAYYGNVNGLPCFRIMEVKT